MSKFFNTAGLCKPGKHYMLDPLKRLKDVEKLIKKEQYFTIHAPRQTGKTTYLYALASKLNKDRDYISLVVSFERAGFKSISITEANETIINAVYRSSIKQLPEQHRPGNPTAPEKGYADLYNYLYEWCSSQEKPIILLIDEIDALMDDVLISVLRQLRDGYQARPVHFPSSIALVGLRDVRDYKVKVRPSKESLGTASPFNIKAKSLFLENFSREDVKELLTQHTTETGQEFPLEVKEEIFQLTQGQPWLTNALANQIVSEILEEDYLKEITMDILQEAKKQLILQRDTHLDSLIDKLKEDRVKRIVQAIINGELMAFDICDDDISYVRDLGIVGKSDPLKFSNKIYAEIIPRVMAYPIQAMLPEEIQPQWFIDKEGQLDMEKVLKEFQEFYQRNSEAWLNRYEFKESAHHLLLMAFLQRVINAGGDIVREMAVGNGRIDLLVRFRSKEFALELKIKWNNDTIEDGKKQLCRYLDKLGLPMGYLVIFDPGKKDWKDKIYFKETHHQDKKIMMVGL
jgi:hypothetical protein